VFVRERREKPCLRLGGWTLAKTGKKIGLSPYRVSDIETGQRTISKAMTKKLAELFGASPAVFIRVRNESRNIIRVRLSPVFAS
jgi:transcriptional regulator with XRE-family HTH domain